MQTTVRNGWRTEIEERTIRNMKYIDVDSFWGHWPLRRVRTEGKEFFEKTAIENNIVYSLVSSFESIFYDDTQDGDAQMIAEMDASKGELPVITLNPMIPCWKDDLKRSMQKWQPCAVRLHPIIHGYKLFDDRVYELTKACADIKLPVMITAALDDPRLIHLIPNRALDNAEIKTYLQGLFRLNDPTPIIFSNGNMAVIRSAAAEKEEYPEIYATITGQRTPGGHEYDGPIEALDEDHVLFGTGYPLYYRKCHRVVLENSNLSEEAKEKLAWKNASRVFGLNI